MATQPTNCMVVLSGLPGVGKTTLARSLSARIGAVHLRIDTIEAALNTSGLIEAAGGWEVAPEAGYHVAYGLAGDFLGAGLSVIADSVNPVALTRSAWTRVGEQCGAVVIDVEVFCSDPKIHRGRVEGRRADLAGLVLPTWEQARSRRYEPWATPVIRVDTSHGTESAVTALVGTLGQGLGSDG